MTKPWFSARAISATVAEIGIYGDIGIGGVDAEAVYQKLSSFRGVRTLNINISSDGGDVVTGFAIYNMFARFPAKKIARIDGLAASMASVIAMVGDEIVMPSNAFIMIHNPWGGVVGEADQMRKFAGTLDMMQSNIRDAYVKRTKLDPAEVGKMMDAETWLTAEQAVKLGFATHIEEPLRMAAMIKVGKMAAKFKGSPLPRDWDAIREEAFARFNKRPGNARRSRANG
ncbi:head maturation protease, ClpP-related [Bradyrhizobium sp. S3.2.12]|uniref:head maturation protease, ClpP-related n=1 Tax=Bradyrhizobium sp. S3.2.12 TaxID=3156387 RepID=UPI0033933D8B